MTATPTKINFNSVNWDTKSNSWKVPGAGNGGSGNTGSAWIPTVPGFYQVSAAVRVPTTAAATGYTQISIYKNGALYRAGSTVPNSTTVVGETVVSAVIDMLTAGTDYIEIWLTQTSGANMSLTGSVSNTYITGCYLRPYTLDSTF